MKQLIFLLAYFLSFAGYGQEFSETIYTDYSKAITIAKRQKKALLIHMGAKQDHFFEEVYKNDTLKALLSKEFISLFEIKGKEKRKVKRDYQAKKSDIILIQANGQLYKKISVNQANQLVNIIKPLSKKTYQYFTEAYKKEFIQTDSTKIYDAINTVYDKSSRLNARELSVAYLLNQNSIISPKNYQLFKTLLPIGNQELLTKFLNEMRPEMYTQEMAEKVAYELLMINNHSTDKAKAILEQYQIPFKKEIDLYLAVAVSDSYKEKKENCLDFALEATTHDYIKLSNCFAYILRNGNQRQIEALRKKYLFNLNEGSLTRTLVFADLLGQLYLSQGDANTYKILKKRNEQVREKFIVQPATSK